MRVESPLFRTTASGSFAGLFVFRTRADGSAIVARKGHTDPRRLRRPGPNAAFRLALQLRSNTPTLSPLPLSAWLAIALTSARQPQPTVLIAQPLCITGATTLATTYTR
jgi:hypothetical protein